MAIPICPFRSMLRKYRLQYSSRWWKPVLAHEYRSVEMEEDWLTGSFTHKRSVSSAPDVVIKRRVKQHGRITQQQAPATFRAINIRYPVHALHPFPQDFSNALSPRGPRLRSGGRLRKNMLKACLRERPSSPTGDPETRDGWTRVLPRVINPNCDDESDN
jgi:hypothetical protein